MMLEIKVLRVVPTVFTIGTGNRVHGINQSGVGISTKQLHSLKKKESVKQKESAKNGKQYPMDYQQIAQSELTFYFLQLTV